MYYKLQQLKNFITDKDTLWGYHNYVNKLLQITADNKNCGVITNSVGAVQTLLFCICPY